MSQSFRLETLLKLRRDHRDAMRDEYAQAVQAGQILRERVESLERQRGELQDSLRQTLSGNEVAVDQVLDSRRYEFVLRLERVDLLKKLEMIEEETERRRENLLEAERELKTVDRLRERWEIEQGAVERRVEQSRLDEFSAARRAMVKEEEP